MTRHFSRWFGKTDLSVEALCRSVDEMERGLIDANLGGGIIKKRVALPGRGKRGSARTLVATNSANRWFFVFGFEKNDRDNINVCIPMKSPPIPKQSGTQSAQIGTPRSRSEATLGFCT
jgi:hypothetical protein